MESLRCLNASSLRLLHSHNLLKTLVKSVISYSKIQQIEVSEEQKLALINKFMLDNKIEEDKTFEEWAITNHGSKENFEKGYINHFRYTTYCKQNFIQKSEERYLERKNNLDTVVYSLIRQKNNFLIEELYHQIAEGEADFGDLATKYSEGDEKTTRGIVGPLPLSSAHPKLIKLIRSSKIKEINPPIRVEDWFIIIRVESLVESKLNDQTRQQMAEEIYNEVLELEVKEKVKELLNQSQSIAT